ncbi:MAG: LamG-like jellyroll fold domain-containing protein [Candidatus Brocadiia bacterium]
MKSSGFLLVLCAAFLLLVSPVGEAGLLGYWPFDGSLSDASGSGNDGAWSDGGPSYGADVPAPVGSGQSLRFDGGPYVDVPGLHHGLEGYPGFTFSGWIKSDATGQDRGFFTGDLRNRGQDRWGIRYDSAGWNGKGTDVFKVGIAISGRQNHWALESSSGLQTTDWQHVVLTWRSGGGMKLYVDGVEDTPSWTRGGLDTVTGVLSDQPHFRIGDGSKAPWQGRMDDVAVWSYAVTAEQAADLANGSASPLDIEPPPPIVPVTYRAEIQGGDNDTLWLGVAPSNNVDGDELASGMGVHTGSFDVPADGTARYIHMAAESLADEPYVVGNFTAPMGYVFAETGSRHLVTNIEDWDAVGGAAFFVDVPFDAMAHDPISRGEHVPPMPGLQAHWPFDETTGQVAYDQTGVNDGRLGSSTGSDGSDPSIGEPGILGTAYRFDGNNDYVEVPDDPSIGSRTRGGLTVSLWLNPDDTLTGSGGQRVLEKGDNYFFLEDFDDGGMNFLVKQGGDLRHVGIQETLNAGTWYHLAGTYDGTDLKVYLDGQHKESLSMPGLINESGLPLRIGSDDSGHWFDGRVDDVAIWDFAVDPTQIQQLADRSITPAGVSPPPSPPSPYVPGTQRIWSGEGDMQALLSAPFTLEWAAMAAEGDPLPSIPDPQDGLSALLVRTTNNLGSLSAAEAALALRPGDADHDVSEVAVVGRADLEVEGHYDGFFARLAPDRGDEQADAEDYAVMLSGYIHIDSPQTRTFAVTADDEFRLTIGDTEFGTGSSVTSPPHMVSVEFPEAGYWPIEVLYRNRSGAAGLEVAVSKDAVEVTPGDWAPGAFAILGTPDAPAVYQRADGLGDTSGVGPNHVGGAAWTGTLPGGTTDGDGIWIRADANAGVGNADDVVAYYDADPTAGVAEHRTQVNLVDTGGGGAFGGNERYPGLPSGDNNQIATRCYGLFYSPGDESYSFAVASDDSFRLRVGDQVAGQFNGGRGISEWSTNFMYVYFPEPGLYPIELHSHEGSGGAALELSHGGPTSLLVQSHSPVQGGNDFNIDLQNRFYSFEPRARLEREILSLKGAAYVDVPAAGLTLAPDRWELQQHVTGRYPGLLGSYYTRQGDWSRGTLLGLRHDLVPAGTGIIGGDSPAETQFHFPDNYGYGPWGDREDNLYVEWTGILTIPDGQGGTYRFAEHVDDRARLFIDDMGSALIHDNTWHNYATASIDLAPGEHLFRYIAIEAGGGEFADLFWLPPGTPDPGHPSDWDYVPADFFSFDADLWLTLAEGTGMLGDLMFNEHIATFPYDEEQTYEFRLMAEYFGAQAFASGEFRFVPEPATLCLLGAGVAALATRRRRRR